MHSGASPRSTGASSEHIVVLLVGLVQFVNVLDFVMVMPLGPDFAAALGVPSSRLGYVAGAYTAAAATAGALGSLFLDRFDRRAALAGAMLGLASGTAACALARGLPTLLAARVVAGAFGGPATALSYAIVADVFPPARRGRAMGAVMSAFSAASVLGVPAGLELARRGGWRAPFVAVGLLGAASALATALALPPLRGHLAARRAGGEPGVRALLARRLVRRSYAMSFVAMAGAFVLVPNLFAFLEYNLGYPRGRLGVLYLAGGAASFLAMRVVGRLIDRVGARATADAGVLLLLALQYASFVRAPPLLPTTLIFVGFMVANAFRQVPINTLTTRVPRAEERARFLSLQSAVQHVGSASGAVLSARMLRERPDHALIGMPAVALVAIALTAALPWLLRAVDAGVRADERARPPAKGGAREP